MSALEQTCTDARDKIESNSLMYRKCTSIPIARYEPWSLVGQELLAVQSNREDE